jgi:hypothetical protein
MSDIEVEHAIARYAGELGIPVTDALSRPPERLVDMVVTAFPQIVEKLAPAAA